MKVDPQMWLSRPGIAALLDALDAAHGGARFVGGAVRDALLDLPFDDLDLATPHAPLDVVARLEAAGIKAVPTGIAHGTITGFGVTPVVASVPPDLPLVPNPGEVADWFEAPLDFVLDPHNQHHRQAWYKGRLRSYYEIVWQGRRIWGATAAMLVNLTRRAR